MAKNLPTYRKLTVTSSPDPNNVGAYDIPRYLPDVKLMETAVKSALKDKEFFYMGERRVDPVTHEEKIDIYVHEDRGDVSKASLDKFSTSFKGSNNAKYTITESQLSAEEQKAVAREEARSKADNETTRFNRSTLLKIVGALTVLTNLVRRILSSVIAFSQQTYKDAITAHNLGMSYEAVHQYKHVETAHGMKEGTIVGSIEDIQKMFGNITTLDEKALESLALVMGGKIQEMVEMGLGASNPEKVLEAILDTFNEKANAGYNSIGQYVGEQQARRELYSYLMKISPQIADIFATMQEEQHNINSIFKNSDTFQGFKTVPDSRGGRNWSDYGVVEITAQQWNKVQEILSQLKDQIMITLAPPVQALLQKIANSRLFMTETERRNLNLENKSKNEAQLKAITKTLAGYEGKYDSLSEGEKAYYDVLVEQKEILEKENKKTDIDDVTAKQAILNKRAVDLVRDKGKVLYREGESIPNVNPTYDELRDVVNAYGGIDTPEARKAYAKSRERDAKNADKIVDSYNESHINDTKKQFREEIALAGKDFEKDRKKGTLKKYYNKLSNSRDRQYLRALYILGKVYGFEYDLDKEEGTSTLEKVMSALKRAKGKYGDFDPMGGFVLDDTEYVASHYTPIKHLDKEVPVDYGDPYLKWLYEQPDIRAEMNEHILGYRADQEVEAMQTQNAIEAWEWFYEHSNFDRIKNQLANGTYVVRGANTFPEYGENVYKIVIETKENGRTTKTMEILNTEGGYGFEGEFANFTVSNGKINFGQAQGTPASKGK